MNRRTWAVLAAMIAWWGGSGNVAEAQYRLGTIGMPGSGRNVFSPYRQLPDLNPWQMNQAPGTTPIQPDGSYAPGLTGPGSQGNQPQALQTGHPVTYFTEQRFFPLASGTSTGTNIGAVGITGVGGVLGYGQGTTGLQQGFYGNSFNNLNNLNNLNMFQRGRAGFVR